MQTSPIRELSDCGDNARWPRVLEVPGVQEAHGAVCAWKDEALIRCLR